MAIFFLRHGQSEANVQGVFAGQKENSPLTELGRSQATEAAHELQALNITKIITSSLARAYETATIVASTLDVHDIITDDRLMEYDMGVRTGTPNKKITSHELVSAEGAENPSAFQQRVISALNDYAKEPGNILLVSHAGVGRIIEATRQGVAPDLFYDIESYPNARVVTLDTTWLKDSSTQPIDSIDKAILSWVSALLQANFGIEKHVYSHQDEVYKIRTQHIGYYLKIGTNLQAEHDNLLKLRSHLLVPEVIGFKRLGSKDYILMTELPGKNLAEFVGEWTNETIVKEFANAIKKLHSLNPDMLYPGNTQPTDVLLHGDMALPNIICTAPGSYGYIDLGQMSSGAPDKDLADALWSLQRNINSDYGELFLKEYGTTTLTPLLKKALQFRYTP